MLGPETFDKLIKRTAVQRFYGHFSQALLKSVLRQPEILELASLRYVLVGDKVTELDGALPRAYTVANYVTAASEEETLAAIRAINGCGKPCPADIGLTGSDGSRRPNKAPPTDRVASPKPRR